MVHQPDTQDAVQLLDSLVQVSARIGRDLDLVQAGGGNTSLKDQGTLWIKASGKWLIHAAHDDMFLPVPLDDVARLLAAGEERFQEYRTRSGAMLRPSVETTMHAVLPQPVVIHVHSVRTIAWASQQDGRAGVGPLLEGLRWSWIPYTHPGVPLARRIQEEDASRPEVLILENHGLVVAAEDCAGAEALLNEVEERLSSEARPAPAPQLETLRSLVEGADWQIAEDSEAHALATDERSCAIASSGTLFPDQCVYLGPAAAVVNPGMTLGQAADAYRARYDFEPVFLLVAGVGAVTRRSLTRAGRDLLRCVKRVIERIPANAPVTYLAPVDVGRLMNWDAEKYRLEMARKTG